MEEESKGGVESSTGIVQSAVPPPACASTGIHSIQCLQPNTPCAIFFTPKHHNPSLATLFFPSSFPLHHFSHLHVLEHNTT